MKTVNIGEISKPSVDRAQVDKKLKVNQSDPVLKTQVISDLVKLSEESQQKYQQEHNKRGHTQETINPETDSETGKDPDTENKPPAIDLRV